MKAFKSTKSKVEEHIQHARKATTIRSKPKGMIVTTFPQPKPYIPPVLKQVDEDVWSVIWDDICVEFIYDMIGDKAVTVYPSDSKVTKMHQDVPMVYGKSVVCFYNERGYLPEKRFAKREEVKPMAEEKKKMTKKEGKDVKKKDYYAGKEVKA